MKTKLALLLIPTMSIALIGQIQANMKNQNNPDAEGKVIKKGKMIYSEITIKASPEKVWQIFTDFENYPSWNPFIKSLKGDPILGKHITAVLHQPEKKAMTFKPKVLAYDSLREFRWIGKLFLGRLFDGEHTFKLKDNRDGTSTFIQYERFRGILVPLLRQMLDVNTQAGFNQMNEALKRKCEY